MVGKIFDGLCNFIQASATLLLKLLLNMREGKNGIHDEFLEIIRNYQGIVRKVCWLYFRNKDERDENFQEVLYQLWKSYPSLQDKSKLGSWIYKVSIYTSIVKIRKDVKVRYQGEIPDSEVDVGFEEEMYRDEDVKRLHAAIATLSDIEKAIIMLHLEEKDYAEIAEITGISKTNAGVKIMRIKEKLKQLLNNEGYGK